VIFAESSVHPPDTTYPGGGAGAVPHVHGARAPGSVFCRWRGSRVWRSGGGTTGS